MSNGAPHAMQKRASSGLFCWHCGQILFVPIVSYWGDWFTHFDIILAYAKFGCNNVNGLYNADRSSHSDLWE